MDFSFRMVKTNEVKGDREDGLVSFVLSCSQQLD